MHKKKSVCLAYIISEFGRLRWEDGQKFKVSLGYGMEPCLKKTNNTYLPGELV